MARAISINMPSTANAPRSPRKWRTRAVYSALFILSMTTSALVTAAAQGPDPIERPPAVGDEAPPLDPRAEQLLAAALSEPQGARRPSSQRDPAATALLQTAAAMGMGPDALHNPCLAFVDSTCVRTALDSFFASLDRATDGEGRSRVTVFGNSLIVRDRITDVWRDRLQDRFGDAGQGFLLVDRMTPYGPRRRTASYARGFRSYNTVWGKRGPWPHAIASSLNVSDKHAVSVFKLRGEQRGRVFWLDHPRAPTTELSADGDKLATLRPSGRRRGRIERFAVPEGAKKVKLETDGARGVFYGVSLEKEAPGVILDTLAVVGSDATRFLRGKVELVAPQLKELEPDLVTLLLGGNEVKRVAWGGSTLPIVRRDLHRYLDRIKATVPDASCLVVGPLENVVGYRGGDGSWETRWQTMAVNRIMKEVAAEEGCAYFELFEAMGGVGALKKLQTHDMLHEDMIHPRGQGLDLVGELLHEALLEAYETSARPVNERALLADRRPLTELEGREQLAAWERRRDAERTEASPLRIYVGDLPGDVDDQVAAVLGQRLHRIGEGLQRARPGELDLPREIATVDVYWRGEAPELVGGVRGSLKGRTRAVPDDALAGKASGDAIFVTTYDVKGAGSLTLSGDGALAFGARRRYAGAILDRPAPLVAGAAAMVRRDRDYAVAIVGEGQQPPPAAACLALSATPPPGCVGLDGVALTGGASRWRERGLLDGEALTDEGERVLARLTLSMLMEPPRPTTVSAVYQADDAVRR